MEPRHVNGGVERCPGVDGEARGVEELLAVVVCCPDHHDVGQCCGGGGDQLESRALDGVGNTFITDHQHSGSRMVCRDVVRGSAACGHELLIRHVNPFKKIGFGRYSEGRERVNVRFDIAYVDPDCIAPEHDGMPVHFEHRIKKPT